MVLSAMVAVLNHFPLFYLLLRVVDSRRLPGAWFSASCRRSASDNGMTWSGGLHVQMLSDSADLSPRNVPFSLKRVLASVLHPRESSVSYRCLTRFLAAAG
jgi:hypothetical protein